MTRLTSNDSLPVPSATKTILLVEDEFLIRAMLAAQFRERGFTVFEAVNALEAAAILECAQGIPVVVTDLSMPGEMDGAGLARWIGANRPDVRVVLGSGNEVPPDVAREVDAHFSKPYDLVRLLGTVSRLIEDARATP